jgi:hypothetical protein
MKDAGIPQLNLAKTIRVSSPKGLKRELAPLEQRDAVLLIGQCALQGYRQTRVTTATLDSNAAAFGFLGAPIPSPSAGLNGEPSLKARLSMRIDREALRLTALPAVSSRLRPRRALDIVWAATTFEQLSATLVDPNHTKLTLIHSLDFDRHLRASGSVVHHGSLALLDSMGPLHPDFVFEGSSPPCSVDKYRDRIGQLLTGIEASTGRNILIAGHPRSTPAIASQLYGDRHVMWGDTYESVAGSVGVLMVEPTTSLGMAVLLEKPILLLDTGLMGAFASQYLRLCGTELSIPILSIDSDPDAFRQGLGQGPDHTSYRTKFLKKPGTPEREFWSVAVEEALGVLE